MSQIFPRTDTHMHTVHCFSEVEILLGILYFCFVNLVPFFEMLGGSLDPKTWKWLKKVKANLTQVCSNFLWAQALPPGRWVPMSPTALPTPFSSVWESLCRRHCSLGGILFGSHTFTTNKCKSQNLSQNRHNTHTHTHRFSAPLANVKTSQFHRKKSVVSKPRSSETKRTRNSLPAVNAVWAGPVSV